MAVMKDGGEYKASMELRFYLTNKGLLLQQQAEVIQAQLKLLQHIKEKQSRQIW